ncbi:hypothetical protein HJFPF1_00124 [Paramyrothecium foliicola]|nr:hypothetical protein HJFPF1_00124 [Paramyrothecium foliicola]
MVSAQSVETSIMCQVRPHNPTNATSNLCEICESLEIEDWPSATVCPLTGPRIDMGTIEAIIQRRDCSLCRLIIGSLFPSSVFTVSKELAKTFAQKHSHVHCYLDPRIHGFETQYSIHVTAESLDTGVIHFLTTPKESTKTAETQTSEGQADLEASRSWLSNCEKNHTDSCITSYTVDIPLILVDVEKQRLVRGSSSDRYIALSYIWGAVPMLVARKDTFTSLTIEDSLHNIRHQLPKTISDAIYAAKMLGEKYLWVDSLCIIQDDEVNKHN